MIKKIVLGCLALASVSVLAQEQEISKENYETHIKGNVLFAPVLVFNGAVEKQISPKMTLQGEVFVSPWKSFANRYAQIYMVGLDARYYFSQAFEKFYVGANVSVAAFQLQKWNYNSNSYYVFKNGETSPYLNKNLYQRGMTVIVGVVGGYQFKLNDKMNLDLYLGIGSSQGFYKGYDKLSGDRYDNVGETKNREWNRSGEILPYKGGLMLTYKLN